MKPKNFQLLEAFSKPWYSTPKDKKKRLGNIYRATLRMKESKGPSSGSMESCLCRVIEFDRITNYVIDDYLDELQRLEKLKLRKCIVPTRGYFITEKGLNIFQPQMISLFEMLHCEEKSELRRNLTIGDKYQLVFNLAKILNTFQAFNPPLIHGHLSAHNVFIELQQFGGVRKPSGVRVGDIELFPLIKYAGTFYGYKNLSVWSSPEILKQAQKKAFTQEAGPEADIYNFGMLMWELWHETIPFDNDVQLCQQYVIQEDARPMILITGDSTLDEESEGQKTCDVEMAKLIRLCWQTSPEQRPKFSYICSLLSQLIPPQS